MKAFYLGTFVLFVVNVSAQEVITVTPATHPEIKQSDVSILSITQYASKSNPVAAEKPKLVTAEDKKLWTRPVYQNPNYHKSMPMKSPNEVEEVDNE
jgi:hypothetical protein